VQRVSRLDLLSAQNSLNLVFAQNSFDQLLKLAKALQKYFNDVRTEFSV
jgi:hypothetical protein